MKDLTSQIDAGMNWETYNRFYRKPKRYLRKPQLPETEKVTEFFVEKLSKLFPNGFFSISLEVGYAHHSKIYVTGVIKTEIGSQRFECVATWQAKENSFEGDIRFKPAPDHEDLWKEYDYHIDLYKFYLEMALKANGFFYAILGAIFSFVLTRGIPAASVKLIVVSLLIPILMSLAFAWTFIRGAKLSEQVRWTINVIKSQLKIERAPDVQILSELLRIFGCIFVLVGAIIIVVMILIWYGKFS